MGHSLRHRYVAVLLEQKREELKENKQEFAKRIYPDCEPRYAYHNYLQIAHESMDIPETRLVYASEVLGIPAETLRLI